ncbi:Signal transduction histidine kinase, glucose-6-phosphate specific [Paraburkholderia piptadeniae]|uniref:Oxygen sensor histidine kinase NreB n=1 Tax=Paraburkholderia piptadeniae TaxID=1701573 RepID=A0A1N7SC73_9BURK|nr:sensor histidine kinase [Paraburkholderia piptadeniae]SIT44998.1 Signal transduction histidine kinase, glucose-6-phosphate specific [Paraburkholderia piptadeniae]
MPEALSSVNPANPAPDPRQAAGSRADAASATQAPAAQPRATPPRKAGHAQSHAKSHAKSHDQGRTKESHSAASIELSCVVVLTVIVWALCATFDVSELAYRWTRNAERYQLDELPVTMFVLAAGCAWFAWRRYRESQRELLRRRAAEEEAARLLADNRRLASEGIEAQEAERRHLARELHDELGQHLNAIALDAARIRDLSADSGEIHRASLAVMQSASFVYRQIGCMIRKLRPIGLDELGLPSALEHCVEGWRERLPDASFKLTVDGDFDGFTDALNITLYRFVQEALTNVSKFARESSVEIYLVRAPLDGERGGPVVVTVADDGPGTDLSKPRAGLGLVGMRERVEALGGEFHVASEPGRGFLLCARVPPHVVLPEPSAPSVPIEPDEPKSS